MLKNRSFVSAILLATLVPDNQFDENPMKKLHPTTAETVANPGNPALHAS